MSHTSCAIRVRESASPARVAPGGVFEVTVRVTGGAGPVVGVALVDAAHRYHARPAPGVGWHVEGPPTRNNFV